MQTEDISFKRNTSAVFVWFSLLHVLRLRLFSILYAFIILQILNFELSLKFSARVFFCFF